MEALPSNPYRPAAGHEPPYLAGREVELSEFDKLLNQSVITENLILSGLRGVGKTVLLNHMKPRAQAKGWLWAGEDLTEQASLSEDRIATRILTDLAPLLGPIFVKEQTEMPMGFNRKSVIQRSPLGYNDLAAIYNEAPGLVSDKLKTVLRHVGRMLKSTGIKGIVFAYDEAQNLSDKSDQQQFPLALLLDVFQSLQRQPDSLPFILVLTGLPTLFPKLIKARTYSERMFHTIMLGRLSDRGSREAVTKPLENHGSSICFTDETVRHIVDLSGGYPYFIQFICKEAFDVIAAKLLSEDTTSVETRFIMEKLDQDFFAGRWDDVTDNQRVFLSIAAQLPNCEDEWTANEVVALSGEIFDQPYSASSVNQYLKRLSESGLVYKNRRGKYQFAVPMMSGFIKRQLPAAH